MCELRAWEVNMDIQPVFNYNKSNTYMCAYFSKMEDECSHAMSQAFKEAAETNCSNYDQMKLNVCAYFSKTQCSVQETIYHIMPELWLRNTFPVVPTEICNRINIVFFGKRLNWKNYWKKFFRYF